MSRLLPDWLVIGFLVLAGAINIVEIVWHVL